MKKVISSGICLLAVLLFTVNLHAQTSITVTTIADPNLTPGSYVTIEVWAHDVANFWGFDFRLNFNPDVLQGVSFEYGSDFSIYFPSSFGYGYVDLAAATYWGDPIGITAEHLLLARVTFLVIDTGYSDFGFDWFTIARAGDLNSLHLSTGEILIEGDGYFSNLTDEIIASDVVLVRRAAWPEHHHFVISKDEDGLQTLYARLRNFSTTATYLVKVEFIINGQPFFSDTITLPPGTITGTRKSKVKDIALAMTFAPGKYKVTAQAHISIDGNTWIKSNRIKRFSFTVVE